MRREQQDADRRGDRRTSPRTRSTHIREERRAARRAALRSPTCGTEFRDRHALIVVRGTDYRRDLRMRSPYVRDLRPVLVGVDGGGDALLEAGLKPDLIIGDMDSASDQVLRAGPSSSCTPTATARRPGASGSSGWASSTRCCPPPGTSQDVAMLVAFELGAKLIVTVGSHFNLIEFLDKDREGMSSTFLTRLRVGEILVDTKGVSRLYRSGPSSGADRCCWSRRAGHVRDRGAQLPADRAPDRPALAEAPGPARAASSGRLSRCSLPLPRDLARRRLPCARHRRRCSASRSARRASSRTPARTSRSRCAATCDQVAARSNADLRARARTSASDFERQAYPGAGRATCCRTGGSGSSRWAACRPATLATIRDAVEPAGADVDSVSVIEARSRSARLAASSTGRARARWIATTRCSARFGRRIGRQLVNGGSSSSACARSSSRARAASTAGSTAIVWCATATGSSGEDKASARTASSPR